MSMPETEFFRFSRFSAGKTVGQPAAKSRMIDSWVGE